MSDDFDLAHDKLPDQPQTAPEVPHADLIARGQSVKNRNVLPYRELDELAQELADALAALGDTLPREQYRLLGDQKAVWEYAARKFECERDEARAERDALAHVIEQAPHQVGCTLSWVGGAGGARVTPCTCWKSTAPAASLALHDAEVKAQALDEALDVLEDVDPDDIREWLTSRAAAIREAAL